jgi:hypothetical protein
MPIPLTRDFWSNGKAKAVFLGAGIAIGVELLKRIPIATPTPIFSQ